MEGRFWFWSGSFVPTPKPHPWRLHSSLVCTFACHFQWSAWSHGHAVVFSSFWKWLNWDELCQLKHAGIPFIPSSVIGIQNNLMSTIITKKFVHRIVVKLILSLNLFAYDKLITCKKYKPPLMITCTLRRINHPIPASCCFMFRPMALFNLVS